MHDSIKQAMVHASERDTRLIFRTLHDTARVFKNAISDEVVAKEAEGCTFEDIRHLVAGARGQATLRASDPDGGVITAGQAVGLIDDIPSCQELIARIVSDCHERLRICGDYFE